MDSMEEERYQKVKSGRGKSLAYVKQTMTEMEALLRDLEVGLQRSGLKGKMKWGSVKVVWKGEALDRLTERLERAAGALQLAVNCYSM